MYININSCLLEKYWDDNHKKN